MKRQLIVVYCIARAFIDKPAPVQCYETKPECNRAARHGYTCRRFVFEADGTRSDNFNISTTQTQACVAGGLNPDCTPKR